MLWGTLTSESVSSGTNAVFMVRASETHLGQERHQKKPVYMAEASQEAYMVTGVWMECSGGEHYAEYGAPPMSSSARMPKWSLTPATNTGTPKADVPVRLPG
jgi:hypothetical protein